MFRKSVLTACITTGRVAVVIFALCCLAISVPRVEAQDQGPAVLPSFLFSTSDVVDESVVPRQDFHARLKKMRQRPEAVAVRIVSIANPAGAAQAGAVRIDLDGQTIVAKKEVQQRKGKGLDAKQFWVGRSTGGDGIDLLYWKGQLAGRFRVGGIDYKMVPLQGPLHALIQMRQLDDPSFECGTEDDSGEAAGKRGAIGVPEPGFAVQSCPSPKAEIRMLVLYTDEVLDNYGSVEDMDWDIACDVLGHGACLQQNRYLHVPRTRGHREYDARRARFDLLTGRRRAVFSGRGRRP